MVYFVRHGNKEKSNDYNHFYNESLRIMDEPLSKKGREDAQRIAQYFEGVDIKKIFVSQYVRTHQTAAPTAQLKNIEVIEDRRVNEINNGVLRNLSDEEVMAAYPQLWEDFMSHSRDVRFPEGESGEEVKARQDSFLNDIRREQGDILVVSHDGYIRILMCNILGLPVYMRYKFKTNMGGITAAFFDREENEWRITAFNQVLI